ncbi:ATP-dependent DNA helicase [Butyrivibrio sp. INlla14]|uniref:ATP-dependent DNA helicase n=1 Tax=Butyrivibrio sp. INlla14 TaxID=1520808 RepID=UPI00115FB86A|nr:ATP-dependent RecD-like DNA helicase [Butyrivibrio sp. INlla14]
MEKKIGSELYYELTLQLAGMYATKYNRITVFSKIDIDTDYSIQISYIERDLTLLGVNSKIKVLNNWKISIAPTCLNRIAKMVKVPSAISRKYGEYDSLMDYLTGTSANLLDIINSSDEDFAKIYDYIYKSAKTHIFGDVLIKLRRDYSFQASPVKNGKHTVRFALLSMKEEILESIMPRDNYYWMYDEPHICSKCKPFEYNPLVSNLTGTKSTKNYVEAVSEVVNNKTKVDCVKPYSTMETLTEETGELYFDIDKIGGAEAIINYNDSLDLWEKANGYKINMDPSTNLAVIDSYERDTVNILGNLLGRSRSGNIERLRLNENYIRSKKAEITDINKEIALKYAFVYSGIMLIYGAAGTGKTTLLEYISDMMRGSSQLFLTKTHTALQNLKRRIGYHSNVEYSTIDSVAKSSIYVNSEIVFIDECSTIDNRTMIGAIGKMYNAKMIVMSGDIYQIESIDFGNWFYYAKDIIRAEGANVELLNNWRTDSPLLKALWDEVRNKKPTIEEKLSMDGDYSEELGEAIFKPIDEDEVVLCLNYDGVFGLNNINRYFQNANTSGREYTWDDWIFKTGDKILFLDTKRFELLYNNLKGKIVDIDKEDEKITFTIEVEAFFTSEQCAEEGIELVSITPNGKSVIRFDVIAWDDELTDEEKKKTVIPFQIAYAVSIHKAQGLEYNSVKVIIPSNNAEKITHSIFYTAITRAKKSLKIYWSSETMRDVIKSFTQEQVEQITLPIIESKLGITSTTAVNEAV